MLVTSSTKLRITKIGKLVNTKLEQFLLYRESQKFSPNFDIFEPNLYSLKGKKMILKVASVIMIASRKSKLPKNMKDILKGADVSKKELSKCYRLILRKICPNLNTNLKPSECISQICNRLSLNGEVEDV